MASYLLYSRAGCCLCEGLEERLRALLPAAELEVVDVDGDPELQARFGLEVPLLARLAEGGSAATDLPRLLPRVPPRLAGEALQRWLLKHP
ncbi:MAG: glutaredoxin family protein [Prochlorococcaceae cyanobacterium]